MPFVEGVHQTHAYHLTKHTVEIVRDLCRKKSSVFSRKRTTVLEKIGHVQGTPGLIPRRRSDGVVPNGVEHVHAALPFVEELRSGCGTVQHLRCVGCLAGETAQ